MCRKKKRLSHVKGQYKAKLVSRDTADESNSILLRENAARLGFSHVSSSITDSRNVEFIILGEKPGGSNSHHVVFFPDDTWKIYIYGKEPVLPSIDKRLSSDDAKIGLLETIRGLKLCIGNGDERFMTVDVTGRKGYADNQNPTPTIRSDQCTVLIPGGTRCKNCQLFRSSLRSAVAKSKAKVSATQTKSTSHTPLAKLNNNQLISRCQNLKKREISLKSQLDYSQKKVEKLKFNEILPPDLENFCKETIELEKNEPTLSPLLKLFIDQQIKCNNTHKNGMRWHPLIVRWALGLKMKSTAAYRYISKSEIFRLPSESTLADYAHYRNSEVGVDIPALVDLKLKYPEGADVTLIADELKLKDGLLYRNNTLTGYIELDDISMAIEEACSVSNNKVATHGLAFMIQGQKQRLTHPVGLYATTGASSVQMYHCFWECVENLEMAGFRVRSFVCDGASANRKMFKLHASDYPEDEVTFRCCNRFADRPIYFVSDVPHLVKTTRNCFENSGSHLKSRYMMLNGKPILWDHVRSLYNDTLQQTSFVTNHKLKHDHINLTSYSRMSVKLAAQVLSESVANGLELKNDETLSSTIEFIRKVNTAFDCMNVANFNQGVRLRNENLLPYKSTDDPRFEWLQEHFINWLREWDTQVKAQPNMEGQDPNFAQLSKATRDGWIITCQSFIYLCKELLAEGYDYVLSKKLVCQDLVEQFFARHRQSCGGNSAPSVFDFVNNTHLFKVTKHVAIQRNTNCEQAKENADLQDLKRRKR